MKKIYENPNVQLLAIASMDVITTSPAWTIINDPHSIDDSNQDYTITW